MATSLYERHHQPATVFNDVDEQEYTSDGTYNESPQIPAPPPEPSNEKKFRDSMSRIHKLHKETLEKRNGIFTRLQLEYEKDITDIANGDLLKDKVTELEIWREEQLEDADLFRQWQIEHAEEMCEFEIKAAEEEYLNERTTLREKMIQSLEDKKRKLQDEREALEISNADVSMSSSNRANTRKLRRRNANDGDDKPTKTKRQRDQKVPPLGGLKEREILDDLMKLREVCSPCFGTVYGYPQL
ncbi:Sds3-like-domain-containing protein [Paraphysoderma sedebokerense]|nr:Sds3-like-domain-containing protein [Paraphysoderma sedebokerense]